MTQADWITQHPYLAPLAHLHAEVTAFTRALPKGDLAVPVWDKYAPEFHAGVPLLLSSDVELDIVAAGKMLEALLDRMAAIPLSERVAAESRVLLGQLNRDSTMSYLALVSLLQEEPVAVPCSGFFRYLGWTILACHFHLLLDSFANWRDEEKWLRNYCPGCGSPPCMAQLTATDPSRRRFLSCTFCGTRWCYHRTGCPFCQNNDDRQITVVVAEGEHGLRLDTCQNCGGYLKTYAGNGNEDFFLADWTSIHLDFLARDHGLKRVAASLYE